LIAKVKSPMALILRKGQRAAGNFRSHPLHSSFRAPRAQVDDAPIGFYSLQRLTAERAELGHLFAEPAEMRKRHGTTLPGRMLPLFELDLVDALIRECPRRCAQ
jgi:hypothetical protein